MINKTESSIKKVSEGISNYTYGIDNQNGGTATKELMELFDKLEGTWCGSKLESEEDYIKMYDDNFYTYKTWSELVKSEIEQGASGMTEEECQAEINNTIWQLPCGWYVQYV